MSEIGNQQDVLLESRDLGASESKGGETDLKQSHIQGNGQEEILDKLEERISAIQQRLQEIHLDSLKTGRNFAKRRQLEAQKRDLKKELIDIAHDHKVIIIDQQEREYQKIRQEEQEKIKQLEEEVKKLRESKRQQVAQKQQQKASALLQNQQQTEQQTQARRKARIIELEGQLNAQNLRNSRRALIDYQLASLKLSYYPIRPYSRVYSSRYSYISPYSYYI